MTNSPLWQTLVTWALVLAAAVYLGRRWWPTLAALLGLKVSQGGTNTKSACGQGACKNCASTKTPKRDHRVMIVRRRH